MIVGLLLKKWTSRIDASLAQLGGIQTVTFDSTTDLVRSMRNRPLDAVLVEVSDSQQDLQAMLAYRSGETGTRIAIVALADGDHALDVALLTNPAVADFLCAPVGDAELDARMQRVLKNHREDAARTSVHLGGYLLSLREQRATVNGEVIELTPREFAIAWLMFHHAGFFVSSAQIIRTVWGENSDVPERTLQSYFYKVRKKMRIQSQNVVMLRTVYSMGYRLDVRQPFSV